ncbi:hypothetical protein AB0O91_10145 [Kitasatospora sp. NPDC089797]|uniref:hypothetical protein n=1 Tax=Kitasatospora sp. NPDC089797 TaxID=3155298 RepID=UPI00342C908D
MADSDDSQASAQVWGAVVVVVSALAVVAAYLINGAPLVLAVAGVETLLVMVYVGRRWRALHHRASPAGHRPRRGTPDAAHCERCRRAREALDARQARTARSARPAPLSQPSAVPSAASSAEAPSGLLPGSPSIPAADPSPDQSAESAADHASHPRRPQGRAGHERPWTAERATARSVDRTAARRGAPGSAGRAVRHQ